MEAPTLETDGVVVTQAVADDADAYFEAQDDELRRRFGTGSPKTREEALEFINNANEQWGFDVGRLRTWAVRETASGPLIGWVSLRLTDHGPEGARQHGAFLEFWAAPEARGRGLVSRAVGLVLDWASRHLGRDWVDAEVQSDNVRSLRLLSEFGFEAVGEGSFHGAPTRRLRLNFERHPRPGLEDG
jgi:RimJ/RimL family protein N-acetyltransferase